MFCNASFLECSSLYRKQVPQQWRWNKVLGTGPVTPPGFLSAWLEGGMRGGPRISVGFRGCTFPSRAALWLERLG